MKQNVTESNFRDAFRDYGRQDQFSYEALGLLYERLCEYEDDTGEEMELDVIALCCDFYESDTNEIAENYSIDLSDCEDDDERNEAVEDYLNEHTWLVGRTSGSFVYQAF